MVWPYTETGISYKKQNYCLRMLSVDLKVKKGSITKSFVYNKAIRSTAEGLV